ncbi:MAG: HAD hydrolase-like protein [Desulfobacteraceae bacterium]|nr:HAD hydrolase-like protein [Desulfobacteraceae bacterium]
MNIFFDLDGTISDPFEGITKSINYSLEKLGHEKQKPERLAQYIGPSLQFIFQELLHTKNEKLVLKAASFFRERYALVGYKENQLYEGIDNLLKAFQQKGYHLFIVTSKREDIACSVIDYFDLKKEFDGIFGCGNIHLSKGQLIEMVLRKKRLDPLDTLMIGDRKFDISAGIENGLKTIGVLWGYGTQEELRKSNASKIVQNIDELGQLLLADKARASIFSTPSNPKDN